LGGSADCVTFAHSCAKVDIFARPIAAIPWQMASIHEVVQDWTSIDSLKKTLVFTSS
jgi:hypothetical protein